MISIQGQTFCEVFQELSERDELDAAEKAAASQIAAYLAEYERLQWLASEALHADDRDAWETTSTDLWFHLRCNRDWNPAVESRHGELIRWKVGHIQFTVAPHTTGATMNVGIDRV